MITDVSTTKSDFAVTVVCLTFFNTLFLLLLSTLQVGILCVDIIKKIMVVNGNASLIREGRGRSYSSIIFQVSLSISLAVNASYQFRN